MERLAAVVLWCVPLLFLFLPRRMGDASQETVLDLPIKVIPYVVGFVIIKAC